MDQKMRLRLPILVAMLVVFFSTSLSAEELHESDLDRGLGLCGGIVSGNGFSYRYFPASGIGYNIAGIYLLGEDYSYFKLGFESIYILHADQRTALYLVAGISYLESWNEDEVWSWDYDYTRITERDWENGFAFGFGMGGGIRTGRGWTSLELVMSAYHETFLPYPQIAFHYLLW